MERNFKHTIILYCENLVSFKHACKLLENFDPLTFPPTEGVKVLVKVAEREVSYYFQAKEFSFLKRQTALLDGVEVNIK